MKNANSPVAPSMITTDKFNFKPKGGLTKREQFAAMAMQGLLSNSSITRSSIIFDDGESELQWIAKKSVEQADYLLAELDKDLLDKKDLLDNKDLLDKKTTLLGF